VLPRGGATFLVFDAVTGYYIEYILWSFFFFCSSINKIKKKKKKMKERMLFLTRKLSGGEDKSS
jgi:hypothetical protein